MVSRQTVQQVAQAFPGIQLIYLFGSRATGRDRAASDTDLAILLQKPPRSLAFKTRLIAALEAEGPIDLTILNAVGSVLKYQVAKDGRLLYERTPGQDRRFRFYARKEFFDFQPTLEFFYQRTLA